MSTAAGAWRARAVPVAVSLAALAMSVLLTDTVLTSQLLALAGPTSLSLAFGLSGVSLAVVALVQFSSLDRRPRLSMLRTLGFGYAAASAVVLALLLGGVAPIPLTVVLWLLSDQISMLVPVVLWSLLGDVFNTTQVSRVSSWILYWVYGAQLLGLAVAAFTPRPLEQVGVPLTAVLVIIPVSCLIAALWVPKAMAGAGAHRGNAAAQSLAASLDSVRVFLRDVPVWRNIVILSTLGAISAATADIGFSTSAGAILNRDAGAVQTYLSFTMLIILAGSSLWQVVITPRLTSRVRPASQLLFQPIFGIAAGLVIAAGDIAASLAVLAVGTALSGVPKNSVDESARNTVMTVVPDSLRARIALVISLGRISVAQVAAAVLALIGSVLGQLWLTGVVAALVAVVGLVVGRAVAAGWDGSLLNWRLQRRKHHGLPDSGPWQRPPEES